MSSLQRDMMKKGLPPLPSVSSHGRGVGGAKRRKRDYTPLPWSDFFDQCQDVATSPGNCFRVYFKGNSGPVLFLLHGGGHSALSWAVFAVAISKLVECEVVAVDLRAHGDSSNVDNSDLSAETLVNDINALIEALFSERETVPPIVLVGHSMGGAIATRAAASDGVKTLVGLAVIDVVEGTAMESLSSMQSYLKGRPKSFKSLETAVEWSIRSGQLRNVESARVSMPGQVKSLGNEVLSKSTDLMMTPKPNDPIPEGDEDEEESAETVERGGSVVSPDQYTQPQAVSNDGGKYLWRIDLKETECHWQGWFDGLSKLFLSISVPKMLILAGVDRLDKQLTIGQMQGKFQMQVLSGCGHSVHEDAPDKVAEVISGFLIRYKFAKLKDDKDNTT